MTDIHLYLGNDAVTHLIEYCSAQKFDRFLMVADKKTYAVLGQAVEKAIKAQGWDLLSVVFAEEEVVPNEEFIFQVLFEASDSERTYIAVGSGTLTDIARFSSHRTRRPFISLPSAPSVDGFTSPSASLVVRNIKKTVYAKPPMAVISDLPTLASAPQAMIAAGFGDILGKAIALADWRLGYLVWDEPYSAEIAQRVRKTLDACVAAVDEIGQATPAGIEKLMFSLVDSGLCMLDYGNSRPASGAEHYMSHFLEMKLLREGRPAVLHGAKVGQCSVLVADLYARLRQISRAEAEARLKASPLPNRAEDVASIERVFGPIASSLVAEQAPFLNLTPETYAQLKEKILNNWDEIQALAKLVPTALEMSQLLVRAGGPACPADLNLSDEEFAQSLEYAHFIRNRFTVRKLARIMNF
jgi:glycerol-1-phosphate dehydrogenase [NAD(P)+]